MPSLQKRVNLFYKWIQLALAKAEKMCFQVVYTYVLIHLHYIVWILYSNNTYKITIIHKLAIQFPKINYRIKLSNLCFP